MPSSNTETEDLVLVEPEPAEPAPAPLILLEPLDGESGACDVDGWCN